MERETQETSLSDEQLMRALREGDRMERLIFGNPEVTDRVIADYLGELCGAASVPVVRGFTAVRTLPKPRTLQEAKDIVDGNL